MLRRFRVFSFGLLIGLLIVFLNPRLKNNFLEYVGYHDDNQRITKSIVLGIRENLIIPKELKIKMFSVGLDSNTLFSVLDGGWVNREKSIQKNLDSQVFVIDNLVNGDELSVKFIYEKITDKENESCKIITIADFELNQGLSNRSFNSYFITILIYLLIMIPLFFIAKKYFLKIRNRKL